MKKQLLFLTVLAFVLAGCSKAMEDNSCYWYFKLVNQTESNIAVVRSQPPDKIIKSGEEDMISYIWMHCGKNDKPVDIYSEDESMQISHSSNETVQIKIGGKILSDIVWTRKYWDFAEIEYEATYTLIVTDELIENILQQSLIFF